jgi:hypothetical protein
LNFIIRYVTVTSASACCIRSAIEEFEISPAQLYLLTKMTSHDDRYDQFCEFTPSSSPENERSGIDNPDSPIQPDAAVPLSTIAVDRAALPDTDVNGVREDPDQGSVEVGQHCCHEFCGM